MTYETNAITIETAMPDDCPALAVMNRQLIDDEGDNNNITVPELENRMRGWLQKGVYTGYLFRLNGETVGYALVDPSDMWMRHFFICREYRRQGHGRAAVSLLFEELGTEEIGLSCLTGNAPGLAFWRSFGHEAYSVKFNIRKPGGGSNAAKPAKQKADAIIREIEEKDYPALLPLWSQFGGYATAENIGLHYNRIKNDERYKTFVALLEDEAVGFIASARHYGIGIEGSYMVIIGIAVKEEAQNKGIGKKLLQHMENYAKEKGVFSIYLNSDFKRTAAHTFYERNGYGKGSYGFGKTINPEQV
ncbi:MAG: GNAT family N-acetyltransferase [Oscillospiraceae bacterium]|nr:GNAT family N-acetyltransferase [Oscillospiraceae bacterium]